jgi:outer membrane protein assembly factor BamB
MFGRRSLLAIVALAGLVNHFAFAADWPRFRGPNGTGIAEDKTIPVKWTGNDFIWKVEMPGLGNSSPVVWKGRVYVQAASKDGNDRMLLCLDAKDGSTKWVQKAKGKTFKKLHEKNTMASASPAVDEQNVYAVFWDGDKQILNAYTHEGKPLWTRDFGSFASQHGAGSSPIPYGGKVYFNNDQDGKAELFCLDGMTGKTIWMDQRPAYRACYASPIFRTLPNDQTELIVTTTTGITGYDASNGTKRWNYAWGFKQKLQLRTVGSPIYTQGILFVTSGDSPKGPRHLIALKLGDKSAQLVWENTKDSPYMSTLVANGKHVYSVNDAGMAGCYEAETGKRLWFERLDDSAFTSSPININGKIYAANEYGDVYVFAANPGKLEVLAKNSLNEMMRATPAVSDERLYLRGAKNLYCIGKR